MESKKFCNIDDEKAKKINYRIWSAIKENEKNKNLRDNELVSKIIEIINKEIKNDN